MTDRTSSHRRLLAAALVGLLLTAVVVACSTGGEQAAPIDGVEGVSGGDTTATTEAPTTTAPPTTTTTVAAAPLPTDPGGGAPLIYRIETTDPVIFITIDDGTVASPEAMQYIKDMQMPVSMFLNEGPVRTHPDYFDELIGLGNWVHTHTLNHKKLTSLDYGGQEREICGMVGVLDDVYGSTGKVGTLLRPPYGASNATTNQAAASCGLQAVVSWTGTIDGGVVTLQGAALRPGDVLLTHFKDDLYANLKAIRQMADAAGLRIARLEDYIA